MERMRPGDWLVESQTGIKVSVERNGRYRNATGESGEWKSAVNELVRSGEGGRLDMKLLRRMAHEAGISAKKNQKIAKERREARKRATMAYDSAVARPFQCHCNRSFERLKELKRHAQETHLSIHEQEVKEKGGVVWWRRIQARGRERTNKEWYRS